MNADANKGRTTNHICQLIKLQTDMLKLFKRKNHDYGDSFAIYGVLGVIVRMGDKHSRIVTLLKRGKQLVNESLGDTVRDLHNYAIMALMLLGE